MCGVKGVARNDGPSHDSLAEVFFSFFFYVARNCFLRPAAVLFCFTLAVLINLRIHPQLSAVLQRKITKRTERKLKKKKKKTLALRSS